MSKTNFFVTGTDTNVGKTVVAAALCVKLDYHYWKPIQSGLSEGTDTDFISSIIKKEKTIPEIYRLKKPAAPLIAANAENVTITIEKIVASYKEIQKPVIVEGAGGLMVPITQNKLVIDLIKALDLSTILVARTTLGTINHTLLSIEALRKYGIKIEGIIFSGASASDDPDVEKSIIHFAKVPRLGRLPLLKTFNYTSLSEVAKNIAL